MSVTTFSRESKAAIMVGDNSIPSEATAISIVYRRQHMLSSESTVRQLTPPPRYGAKSHGTGSVARNSSVRLPNRARTSSRKVSMSRTRDRPPPSRSARTHTIEINLTGRVPVGSICVQFFTLKLAAMRSGQISRWLDVMHKLSAGLLVGPSHQLAKCAIDADEQPVSLVVTNALNQRTVRPPGNPAANLADKPVKTRRRGLPNTIMHQRLQIG